MEDSKTVFADKIKTKSKITLVKTESCLPARSRENSFRKNILEDWAVAEVFNNFFVNIVPNLKISIDHDFDTDFIATDD